MALVRRFFWNPDEGRLRATWRIALFVLLWRVVTLLLELLLPPAVRLSSVAGLSATYGVQRGLHFFFYLLAVLLAVGFATRLFDRRPLTDLGLRLERRWWSDLAFGLVLGVLLIALLYGVAWVLGWVEVTETFVIRPVEDALWVPPFVPALVGPFAVFVVIAVVEELVFRGYLLRNAAEGLRGLGARTAVLLSWLGSSALFGLFHIYNPHATWGSTLNLALMGMMFGLGMVLTGRLALPIGLHLTWNFAQGSLFGVPVSGNKLSSVMVLVTRDVGPPLWMGGPFGPEAGLLGVAVTGLGCLLIVLWVWRQEGSVRVCRALAAYDGAT